jgi:cytochrome c-type protein NapC/trimethylamine-N-oxide reductase cytochrome c-type subunit TorC
MAQPSTPQPTIRFNRTRRLLTFLAGVAFAILLFVLINLAMAPVSKSQYCGSSCHEMQTAYQTWELSPHGVNRHGVRIECVDCHMPPKEKFFTHLFAKAHAGAKDMFVHHFGGEYDGEKVRKHVKEKFSNDTCLYCHKDLLVAPSGFAAQSAHSGLIDRPHADENKCLNCHPSVGHERTNRLFPE